MDYTYTIDNKRNMVHIKYSGKIKFEDSFTSINAITADPNFVPGMNILIDVTKAEINWSLTDMDKLRAVVKSRNEADRKWAMIATGGITQMNARLFSVLNEAFNDSLSVRLFNNEEDAIEWLCKKN